MIIGAGSPATFTLDVFCSADVAAVPKFIVDPQFMDAVGVMGVIMSSGCVALASGRAARGRVVVTGVIVEFEPEEKGGGIDGVVITALSRFEDMPSSTCVCDAWIAFSSYRCVLPISCVFTLILMFSFSPKENHTHIIKLLAVELHHLGPALIGLTQEEQRVEVRLAGFGRPEIHCVVIEKCPNGSKFESFDNADVKTYLHTCPPRPSSPPFPSRTRAKCRTSSSDQAWRCNGGVVDPRTFKCSFARPLG